MLLCKLVLVRVAAKRNLTKLQAFRMIALKALCFLHIQHSANVYKSTFTECPPATQATTGVTAGGVSSQTLINRFFQPGAYSRFFPLRLSGSDLLSILICSL